MKEANEIAEKRCAEGDIKLLTLIAEEKKLADELENQNRELKKTETEQQINENEVKLLEKILEEKKQNYEQCKLDFGPKAVGIATVRLFSPFAGLSVYHN